MAEKTIPREDLLELIREGIESSPALAENKQQKAVLTESVERLEIQELEQLYGLLQAEGTDWQRWIAESDKSRDEILKKGREDTTAFVKDAQLNAEKQISTAEIQAAEKLLKNY